MSEHEVHEIQLNGKQLVFMFMAATVVSVVIFLCGVMVGRGVKQPDDVLGVNTGVPIDSTVSFDDVGSGSAPAADTAPAPAPEEEDLTYPERLEAPAPVKEPVKPAPAPKPEVAPAVNEKPAPPPERVANTRFAEPSGKGYVIQVMAYPTRAEAEALAAQLTGKGYSTMFVTVNDDAPRARYRVRVGKFASKRERDAVAARLQKDRFKPWLIP